MLQFYPIRQDILLLLRNSKFFITSFFILAFAGTVSAETITVTSNGDTHAVSPLSSPLDAGGQITLRSAIESATQNAESHTIVIPASITVINLTLGQITVGNAAAGNQISVNGPGKSVLTINQTTLNRVFSTGIGTVGFNLTDLTLNYSGPPGTISGGGGAIQAGGVGAITTLDRVAITNFNIQIGNGGAMLVSANGFHTLNVTNCDFTNNYAGTTGGAVSYNGTGTCTISNCRFTNNSTGPLGAATGGSGGALSTTGAGSGGTYSVTASSFVNNQVLNATAQGGAIINTTGALTVNYCRFIGNSAATPALGNTIAQAGGVSGSSTDAENNWWGVNSGPAVNDNVVLAPGGSITITKWLQLKTTASPNPICASGANASTITAGFLSNSAGETISASDLNALIGLPVTWIWNSALGGLGGVSGKLGSNGTATAVFNSNGTAGNETVNTIVDNIPNDETSPARANITVNPSPVVNDPTVTQPTCSKLTGQIVVNATGVGTLEYALNNGSYTTDNLFPDLAPGNYTIHVRSQSYPSCVTDYSSIIGLNAVEAVGTVSVSIASDAASNTICPGINVNFTATPSNGGDNPTYQWQVNGINAGSNSATFSSTTLNDGDKVTVQMTSSASCADQTPVSSNTITMIVNTPPTAVITGPSAICNGQQAQLSIQFTGTAPFQYSINNGPVVTTSSNPEIVPVSPISKTTYAVTSLTDNNSCTATSDGISSSVTVDVNPLPSASLSGGATVCQGGPNPVLTFSGSGGTGEYIFAFTSSDGTTTSPVVKITGNPNQQVPVYTTTPGTFTYTLLSVQNLNSAACMQNISGQTAVVTVNPAPNATIATASSVTSVSTGNTAMVNDAGPNATYSWQIVNGQITSDPTLSKITYKAGISGNVSLTVTVSAGAGCTSSTSSAQVTISPQPCPNPAVTVAPAVCSSSVGNIASVSDAGSGASYKWTISSNATITKGQGTNSITFTAPASNGEDQDYDGKDIVKITVSVTNSSGVCTVTGGPYRVFVSPYPKAVITTASSVCTASSGNIACVPYAGTGATYTWSISNGSTITTGAGTNKITYKAAGSGTVTLSVSVKNKTGCAASSGNKTITIVANPIATISSPASVCAGSCGNHATAANAGTGALYVWSITNGTITWGNGTASIYFTAGNSGTVTLGLTVINSIGCSMTATAKSSSITALPNATITTASSVCGGSSNSASAPAGGSKYSWSVTNGTITKGAGTNSITYTAGYSGTVGVTVTVTNSNGCTSTKTSTVTIKSSPSATITAAGSVCEYSTGNLASVNSAGSGATYLWTIKNGSFTSANGSSSIKYTAGGPGSVQLSITVTNSGGCKSTGNKTLTVTSWIVPAFNPIYTLCVGSKAPVLPTTSLNGIKGTWSPSTISTSAASSKLYTFTPASGQCATSSSVTIAVQKCTTTVTAEEKTSAVKAEEQPAVSVLTVRVLPNPTQTEFLLTIMSNRKEVADIRVFDMLGRPLNHLRAKSLEPVHFGGNYTQGMYVVEVMQGPERKTIKVIKQ